MRPAVPDHEAAEALKEIVKGSPLPVIADIHYDHTLALLAIEAGVACLRLNPGNIPDREKVTKVVNAAKERQIPFRIGVNAGSLPEEVHKSLREDARHRSRRSRADRGPDGRGRPRALQDPGGPRLRAGLHQGLAEGDRRLDQHHGQPQVRRGAALPDPPGRDRVWPGRSRKHPQRGGHGHPALRGHRRHDPRLAGHRPIRARRSGSPTRS